MFNKKICFISSLMMIIFMWIMSPICFRDSFKLEFTPVGQLYHLIFFIFNIIVYFIYLKSDMNKWFGYFAALATAIVCYIIHIFYYHFYSNFRYWGTGSGTELGTALFIFLHATIGLICGVIYFIMWVRSRK